MKARGGILLWLLMLLPVLAGCATPGANADDPLEGFNRKVYAFNDKLDRYALKPVAQGYQAITPLPARTGISNFFGNLGDVWTSLNNLLQGKPTDSLSDLGRFALNSTVGILGFFDVATEVGMEKHDEDFGQTLAVWGVGNGPYLVLPLFGSSTLRDTAAMPVDFLAMDAYSTGLVPRVAVRNAISGVKLVNARAQLLGAETTLDEAALDKYVFMRNFFLQKRRSDIYDGHPPRQRDDDYYSANRLTEPLAFNEVYPHGLFDLVFVPGAEPATRGAEAESQ